MKLLILSHGNLAASMYETLGLFTQERDGIEAIGLGVDMDLFKAQVRAAVLDCAEPEILVLVDLFGGTPFNQLAATLSDARSAGKKVELISGLNLPMLLEVAFNLNSSSLDELKKIAADMGKYGIRDLMAELEEKKRASVC